MDALKQGADALFILLGGIMVLAMHAGFAFLELGTVRSKNQVNALVKILTDFSVSTVAYFCAGSDVMHPAGSFVVGAIAGAMRLRRTESRRGLAPGRGGGIQRCGSFDPQDLGAVRARLTGRFLAGLGGRDVLGVEAEGAAFPVLEPALEGDSHGAEGYVLPRDVGFLEQGNVEALLARRKTQVDEPGPVKDMDLVYVWNGQHRECFAQLDACPGFFERLPQRTLTGGLLVLHEPGG